MIAPLPPSYPWNFGSLEAERSSLETSRVVVLPVPYDGTASFRAGARDGPTAIIRASRELEMYDLELGCDPSIFGIATLPELEPSLASPQETLARVTAALLPHLQQRKLPVTLGGDHSITYGAVRAVAQTCPGLSVLQLDAHADLRDSYMGSRFSHACIMRRVRELCPAVQVGVRSLSAEEQDVMWSAQLPVFFYGEGHVWDETTEKAAIAALGQDVYITVDLDVFDPAVMPAVGTPEPGGMDWPMVTGFLRRVAQSRRIRGFDIVELSPDEGPVACAYLAAKLTYKLIGYALTLGPRDETRPPSGV
ncbi:MAG: agmatinase [Chloroflexi bacterium]|nr:agmatinase [Chloroflexota bacterium]